MLFFKFSKEKPLQIQDTTTKEIIQLHVPEDYKNKNMVVGLTMTQKYKIIRKSAEADSKKVEAYEKNHNK